MMAESISESKMRLYLPKFHVHSAQNAAAATCCWTRIKLFTYRYLVPEDWGVTLSVSVERFGINDTLSVAKFWYEIRDQRYMKFGRLT